VTKPKKYNHLEEDLRDKITEIVNNHQWVKENCPPRHTPIISVEIGFKVPEPMVSMKTRTKKLKVSDRPFTDVEFDQILALPLSDLERRFVLMMQKRQNRPITQSEMTKAGFHFNFYKRVGNACTDRGLWWAKMRMLPESKNRSVNWEDRKYQFVILEEESE